MKIGELYTDIIVVQTYYYDIVKDIVINGFTLNGEKYRCLTASAGQIRTKKTVFIKESIWNQYEKTFMCGLTLDKINDKGLMINHENGKSRPTYFTIKNGDILWFIPLSSKVSKYMPIIEKKIKNMVVVNL